MQRVRRKSSPYSYAFQPISGKSITGGGYGKTPSESTASAYNKISAARSFIVASGAKSNIDYVMVDHITPGFHTLVKKGEFRPINPMSRSLSEAPKTRVKIDLTAISKPESYQAAPGRVEYQTLFGAMTYVVNEYVPTSIPVATSDDIDQVAIEAMANLKSAGMDYLTSIAEARELLAMFTGLKARLTDRIDKTVSAWERDLRHKKRTGKFRGFFTTKEAWESFSAFWLEYRFGWRILAYDIIAIRDYLKSKEDAIALFTRRSQGEFSDTNTSLVGSFTARAELGRTDVFRKVTSTEQIRCGYSAYIDPSILGNPVLLNTGWDIMPWSLVIDMFFNVQDNILANSAMPVNAEIVKDSGFVSSMRRSFVEYYPVFVPGSQSILSYNQEVSVEGIPHSEHYSRSLNPAPGWNIQFSPSLDVGKIVDLATLVLPFTRAARRLLK